MFRKIICTCIACLIVISGTQFSSAQTKPMEHLAEELAKELSRIERGGNNPIDIYFIRVKNANNTVSCPMFNEEAKTIFQLQFNKIKSDYGRFNANFLLREKSIPKDGDGNIILDYRINSNQDLEFFVRFSTIHADNDYVRAVGSETVSIREFSLNSQTCLGQGMAPIEFISINDVVFSDFEASTLQRYPNVGTWTTKAAALTEVRVFDQNGREIKATVNSSTCRNKKCQKNHESISNIIDGNTHNDSSYLAIPYTDGQLLRLDFPPSLVSKVEIWTTRNPTCFSNCCPADKPGCSRPIAIMRSKLKSLVVNFGNQKTVRAHFSDSNLSTSAKP